MSAPDDRPTRRGLFRRPGTTRRPPSRLRRRVGAGIRLVAALTLVGGLYTAFAPGASAEDSSGLSAAAQRGKGFYEQTCVSCHGANAQGVPGRGPSLIGVGSAAVEFQVDTGRMPAAGQGSQIEKKHPLYNNDQATDIGAYIEALGGGPQLPPGTDYRSRGNIANGGELFRVNCASCHQYAARGGALSSGKYAPTIEVNDRDLYAAMLSGPQNMPVFGDNQLTPQEKYDIIAYVQNLRTDADPGGWGIGRLGPVPEAIVIFLVGLIALVFATLWIAGKS